MLYCNDFRDWCENVMQVCIAFHDGKGCEKCKNAQWVNDGTKKGENKK